MAVLLPYFQVGILSGEVPWEIGQKPLLEREVAYSGQAQPGLSGTTELTTLNGTRFVGSTLELWTGTVLGAIEKAAPPAMLAATVLDIGAHARCSALPGGALSIPSEGMYGAIP